MIKNHVLLRYARGLEIVDEQMATLLARDILETIVSWIPEGWLTADGESRGAAALRSAYLRYLLDRLTVPRPFLEELRSAS